MRSFIKSIYDERLFLFLLITLTFIVYATAFQNDFLIDDIPAIQNNQNIGNIGKYISEKNIIGIVNSSIYLAFGSSPSYYHIFSALLHLANVIMVFLIAHLLSEGKSKWIPRFTAAIFALHPLAVESVVWISAMPYLIYSLFLFLSFFTFVLVDKKYIRTWWISISILFFIVAMATSIKSIIFIGILLVYLFSFSNLAKKKIMLVAPWAILIVLYFTSLQNQFIQRENDISSSVGKLYLLNPFKHASVAIFTYIKLFIFPYNLTFYYDFNKYFVFTKLDWFLSTSLLVGLMLASLLFAKFYKPLAFAILFFLIALLPNFIPLSSIAWLVAERYVYFGLFGLSLAIAYTIYWLLDKKSEKIAIVVLVLLLVYFIPFTIRRNLQWRDAESLYKSNIKTYPNSSQAHYYLAEAYFEKGDTDKAIKELESAIYYSPKYIGAMYQLGKIYFQKGDKEKSLEQFNNSLDINPTFSPSIKAIAMIAYEDKDYDKAIEYFEKSVLYEKDPIGSYLSLFVIYASRGDKQKAQEVLNKAQDLAGNDPSRQQMVRQAVDMISGKDKSGI